MAMNSTKSEYGLSVCGGGTSSPPPAKKSKSSRKSKSSPPQQSLDLIADDLEVWTLRIPKHVNVDKLHDQLLTFPSSKKRGAAAETDALSVGGGKAFQAQASKNPAFLPVLLDDAAADGDDGGGRRRRRLVATPVRSRGEIRLAESSAVVSAAVPKAVPVESRRRVVALPCGLREDRHPILGRVLLAPAPAAAGAEAAEEGAADEHETAGDGGGGKKKKAKKHKKKEQLKTPKSET